MDASDATSRILLVVDNADMRDYLRRLLSQRWQVEIAENGVIARYLVELHRGTIAAYSAGAGQGATFTVRLPLLNQQEENPAEETLT